jgi:hypothetical protein
LLAEPLKLATYIFRRMGLAAEIAGERGVGHQRRALACTFIDDGEDGEAFGWGRATPL